VDDSVEVVPVPSLSVILVPQQAALDHGHGATETIQEPTSLLTRIQGPTSSSTPVSHLQLPLEGGGLLQEAQECGLAC
jgi:hypothetical protein